MSDKRFHVIFTGKLAAGTDKVTVVSNLVLDLGLSEQKAKTLLTMSRVVLKRFPTDVEAQRLAERFERAGAVCVVEDRAPRSDQGASGSSGESSLITVINRFPSGSRQDAEAIPGESSP